GDQGPAFPILRYVSLHFSPDGNSLAIPPLRHGPIQLLDLKSGQTSSLLPAVVAGIDEFCLSPNHDTLATRMSSDLVSIWSVTSGQETGRIDQVFGPMHSFGPSMAFSPDGKLLAVTTGLSDAYGDAGILISNVETAQVVENYKQG